MDTKKLYIQSQKKVLNWGIAISAFLFSLTFFSFSYKSSANSLAVWISSIVYTLLLVCMIINRIKIKKKVALTAFLVILSFSIYSILDSLIRFKTLYASMLQVPAVNKSMLIFSYLIGFAILFGLNFFFYKVYKATQNILMVESSEDKN